MNCNLKKIYLKDNNLDCIPTCQRDENIIFIKADMSAYRYNKKECRWILVKGLSTYENSYSKNEIDEILENINNTINNYKDSVNNTLVALKNDVENNYYDKDYINAILSNVDDTIISLNTHLQENYYDKEFIDNCCVDINDELITLNNNINSVYDTINSEKIEILYEMDNKLNNFSQDYYTKEEVNTLIDNTISGELDLTNYYTKSEVENLINDINLDENLENYYTKNQIDNKLNDYYNKDTIDTKLTDLKETINFETLQSTHTTIQDYLDDYYDIHYINTYYYKKSEIDNLINNIDIPTVDLSNYYTKNQIDNKLNDYCDRSYIENQIQLVFSTIDNDLRSYYYNKDEIDNLINSIDTPTVNLSNYYTKNEVDTIHSLYYKKNEIDTKFLNYYTRSEINNSLYDVNTSLFSIENRLDTLEEDTGWIEVPVHGTNYKENDKYPIKIRRIGKIVHLQLYATTSQNVVSGGLAQVCVIPEQFRPSTLIRSANGTVPTSKAYTLWDFEVAAGGGVNARCNNSALTANITVSAYITWMVD